MRIEMMLRSLWIIFFLVSSGFSVSVCIDPGHGGTDAGALGEYIQEKDANLMVALSCRDYLRNYTAVTVGLTRETDITLSLAERTEYANSRGFNWFISIHHNAYNGQVQGTETFRHTTQSETSWAGQLQSAVHPWLIWAFGYTDRGKKQADFYVLRNTVMPAILGEASFIDYDVAYNESWRFYTNWNDHIGREGYAYARGFCDLLGIDFPDYGVPESIVVDDGDPGFSVSGSWNTTSTGGYRDDYRWTSTTYQGDYATFSPSSLIRGNYNVYIWYREGTNRSIAAIVEIYYYGGSDRTTVNQQVNGRRWNLVGTYPFSGSGGYVKISDVGSPAGLVVIADAVKWVYISPLDVPLETYKPKTFELYKNFPNPFNVFTTIPFSIENDGYVKFEVFDLNGRRVYSLGPLFYPKGYHTIKWDATLNSSAELPSGVYFGVMFSGGNAKSLKMILQK